MAVGVVVLLAVVLLAVSALGGSGTQHVAGATSGRSPAPASVVGQVTGVSQSLADGIGVGGDVVAPKVLQGEPALAYDGKPGVLYIGAEFCPYCAADMWPMIVALSRFGTFSDLKLTTSSAWDVHPSTATFSFYGAHYVSRYIELQSVEQASDEPGLDGRYVPLEHATPAQEALLQRYDVPPYVAPQGARGIPFILIGQRYMWSGSPFSPELLANRSQAGIAAGLPGGTDEAARAILVNGNEFTAAICVVTRNQPADVCSDPVIQHAIAALPTKPPS